MARRLLNHSNRRELLLQRRLLLALERRYSPVFAREIVMASGDLSDSFARSGAVPYDMGEHRKRIEAIYSDLSKSAVDAFGKRILDQGKASGRLLEFKEADYSALYDRIALDYIANEAVRQRITKVTETTREDIVRIVAQGQAEGLAVREIADRINAAIPDISRYRGSVIGRTETHGAANSGAQEAAKAAGLPLLKEWVASESERTREDHRAADGQRVEMEQPFSVGGDLLMYPGDPAGSAGQVINCRCAVVHVVQ